MSLHQTAAAIGDIDYAEFYADLGTPLQLAYLAAEIDEHEPVLDDLSAAIERNADLELVWPKFALWLFEVELGKYETSAPIAALYRGWVEREIPSAEAWKAAAAAAKEKAAEATWTAKDKAAWAAEAATRAAATTTTRAAAWAAKAAFWAAEEKATAAARAVTRATWTAEAEAEAVVWNRYAAKLKELLLAGTEVS